MALYRPVAVAASWMLIVGLAACSGTKEAKPESSKRSSTSTTSAAKAPEQVDLLIRGGTIYNGDDLKPTTGDVGVVGDRIVYVGASLTDTKATRQIDATGMIVTPGFIDAHTHADGALLSADAAGRVNLPFLTQGVSTVVIGNDGYGTYKVGEQVEKLKANPPGTNVAMFVGFGPVRQSQLGDADTAPTAAQLDAMKTLVADAMCQGAIGLSTGLYYTPQNFSKTDEVVALAKVAASYGGVYDSHIRDEQTPDGLRAAIAETLQIGREADIPVHVAHIKALGADAAGMSGEIIKEINKARKDGLKVTADQYPWLASGTMLSAALLPPWANEGGADARRARLDDPAMADRLRTDIAENLRRRNGPESIVIVAGNPDYVGKTLAEIADTKSMDAVDATIQILRESDTLIANFNQTEKDVRAFMKQPWVGTSSDSTPGHPRSVASFSQKYHEYVKEQKIISTGEFVRSSTSVNADAFGLKDRGRLKIGQFADITVFDPDRYAPTATYTEPNSLSVGVVATVVNGQVALENDKSLDVLAGRPLVHIPTGGKCSDSTDDSAD